MLALYADTSHGKEKASNVFERVKAGDTINDVELQMQKSDGTLLWVSLTVNVTRDAKGRIVESRSMVTDITERKQAQKGLQKERDCR